MKNEFNLEIGKKIKARRKELGFTQEDLADFLDTARTTIVNIEQGNNGTSFENLYKICCALEIEISKVFPPLHKVRKDVVLKEKIVTKLINRTVISFEPKTMPFDSFNHPFIKNFGDLDS